MELIKDVSPTFNIKMGKEEEINLRLNDKNAVTVTIREGKATIALGLHEDPLLEDGGRISSYARIEIDLKEDLKE